MPNTPNDSIRLSDGTEIKLGSIYYELGDTFQSSENGRGKKFYLTKGELMALVDYGINQMSEEEKKQLYKDHGFDNFHE